MPGQIRPKLKVFEEINTTSDETKTESVPKE